MGWRVCQAPRGTNEGGPGNRADDGGPLVHAHIHHSHRALVELGLRGPRQMATVPPLQSLLGMLGLMVLQSRVPRQSRNSHKVPMKLGLLGPEHMAAVPPTQQQQSLLVKIGPQES